MNLASDVFHAVIRPFQSQQSRSGGTNQQSGELEREEDGFLLVAETESEKTTVYASNFTGDSPPEYNQAQRMIGILVKLLILSTDAFLPGRCNILRDLQESTKFWTNSKQEEFRDTGCNISAGWNLTGREWGCCGNYEGCCKMASKFCYLHDSICQCCQLGWIICGPECKPDIGCLSPTEKADSEDELTSPSFQLSASLNSSTNENKTLQNHSTNSSYFTKNNKELNKISAKKNGNYDISDSMLLQNITKEAKSADSQDPSLLKHHHEQLNRNRGTQHTTSKATATFKFQDGEQTNDDTLYTSKTTGIVNDELEYSGLSINIPNSNIIEGSGEVN